MTQVPSNREKPIDPRTGAFTPAWDRFFRSLVEGDTSGKQDASENLTALSAVEGWGLYVRTRFGALVRKVVSSTLSVAAGDGQDGDITVNLAELADSGVGAALKKFTRDIYGRISGTQAATTSDLTEGANLYFTDERVDDRVAALIVDSASVEWAYDDALGSLTGTALPAGSDLQVQFNDDGVFGGDAGLLYDKTTNVLQTGNLNIMGGGLVATAASGTANAGLRVPHGTAPSSPANGDIWTTTAGLYVQISGSPIGPLAQDSIVIDSIADGDATHAPSRNAVFDALAGKQPLDATLTALAGVTTAADKVPVFTGTDAASTITVASGTYTPTLTNVTNVSSSVASQCQYLRVGNTVTVSGRVDITPTAGASTLTRVDISLPIASNFAAGANLAGAGGFGQNPYAAALVIGDTVNDRCILQFYSNVTASTAALFTFTYLVI